MRLQPVLITGLVITCSACNSRPAGNDTHNAVTALAPENGAQKAGNATGTAALSNAAAPQARDQASTATGVMAKVPVKLGYYVSDDQKCADPYSVTKLEPNAIVFIADDGATRQELKSAEPDKQSGGYLLGFSDADDEMGAAIIKPTGTDRIEMEIQDTASLHACAVEELPAKYRK